MLDKRKTRRTAFRRKAPVTHKVGAFLGNTGRTVSEYVVPGPALSRGPSINEILLKLKFAAEFYAKKSKSFI